MRETTAGLRSGGFFCFIGSGAFPVWLSDWFILSVPMLYRISFFILPILEKAPWEFANFRIIVYLCRTFAQKAKKQVLCSFLLMLEGWGLSS